MERVCFLARVRPDRLDEYRERHENVWPEMRAALAEFFVADGRPASRSSA